MKLFFLWLCSLFFVRVFTFCSYILLIVIATCSLRVTCGGSLQNAMQINILSSVLNSVWYNLGTLYVTARRRPGMKDQEQSMHVWKKITSVPFAVYDTILMVCPMNYAHIFIEFKGLILAFAQKAHSTESFHWAVPRWQWLYPHVNILSLNQIPSGVIKCHYMVVSLSLVLFNDTWSH